MEDLKTLKACEILTPNDEDILLFSHKTSSMKLHHTETHEDNFEIPNIVLSSQITCISVGCVLLTKYLLKNLVVFKKFADPGPLGIYVGRTYMEWL